jgi:mannose-1-phosphate guanylyltransferase
MGTHVNVDRRQRHTWALVLAAGEGVRLSSLTTTASGTAIPKQYCSLWEGPSLLEDALRRAQRVVARERVCAVVDARHRQWWEPPLWALPARNTIVQPDNRGTAASVLLPLMHILRRDPVAQVLIIPSNHYVRDEPVLARSLQLALDCAAREETSVLLGFPPGEADAELGYIVSVEPAAADGTFAVAQLVKEPAPRVAREMIEQQLLRNGFIVATSARALAALYVQRCPDLIDEIRQAADLDAESPADAVAASDVYARLPARDFSHDVLKGMEARLRVLPVPDCGWTHLASPTSVVKVLRDTPRPMGPAVGPAHRPWGLPALSLSAQSALAAAVRSASSQQEAPPQPVR